MAKINLLLYVNSPLVLFHVAVGAGLPSTLHKMEKVSFSFTAKSALGTVSVILTGAEKDNRNFTWVLKRFSFESRK